MAREDTNYQFLHVNIVDEGGASVGGPDRGEPLQGHYW